MPVQIELIDIYYDMNGTVEAVLVTDGEQVRPLDAKDIYNAMKEGKIVSNSIIAGDNVLVAGGIEIPIGKTKKRKTSESGKKNLTPSQKAALDKKIALQEQLDEYRSSYEQKRADEAEYYKQLRAAMPAGLNRVQQIAFSNKFKQEYYSNINK